MGADEFVEHQMKTDSREHQKAKWRQEDYAKDDIYVPSGTSAAALDVGPRGRRKQRRLGNRQEDGRNGRGGNG